MPCQKTYNSRGTNCCNKPRSIKKRDQAIQFGNITLPVPYTVADNESDNGSLNCNGDEDDNLGEPVKLALVNAPAKASCSDCSVQILVDYCKKGKTRTCKCDQGPKRIRPKTLKSFKSNCSVCGIPFNIKRNASKYHRDCIVSNRPLAEPCGIYPKRNSSQCSCNKSDSCHGENSKEVLIRKYNYTIPCQRRSKSSIAQKTCIIPNRVLIDCSNKNCKNASTFTEDWKEEKHSSSSCNCSSSEDESSGSVCKQKSKEDIKKEKKKKKEADKKKKQKEKKEKKEREKKEKERKKREKEKNKEKDRESCKSSRSASISSVCCSDDGDNNDGKKKAKQKKKDKKSKDKKKSQSTQKIEIIFDDDEKKGRDANKSSRSKRRSDDNLSNSSRTSSSCCSRDSQKGKNNKKDKKTDKKKDKKKNKNKCSEEKHSQTKVKDKCCTQSPKSSKQNCKGNRRQTRSIKSSGNVCCQKDDNIRASAYYGRNVPFGCGSADKKQSCYLVSQQSNINVEVEPVCHHQTRCDEMPPPPPCHDLGNQDTSSYQKLQPRICNHSCSNTSGSKFNTNYGLSPVEYGRKFDELCKKQLMKSAGRCTLTSENADNCEILAQMANPCPEQNYCINDSEINRGTSVQMDNPCPAVNYCWEIPTEDCGTCVQLDNPCPNPVNYCWDQVQSPKLDPSDQTRQMGNDCWHRT